MSNRRKNVSSRLTLGALSFAVAAVAMPGLARAEQISVEKTDSRQMDNVSISVHYNFGGHPFEDWEAFGTLDRSKFLSFTAADAQWENGVIHGNFLQFISESAEPEPGFIYIQRDMAVFPGTATDVSVAIEFYIGGNRHWDYEYLGTLNGDVQLVVDGNNGTWNSSNNTYVGDFLHVK